ncbi:MAG TPA: hypothetical protein VFT69_14160 [Pseudolabrys sp.]|nr:hypothetical protein [Pseudolabrys sp.]
MNGLDACGQWSRGGHDLLYVDIPSSADIRALTSYRGESCDSIYLPTTPITQQAQADRIALKNLAREAVQRLQAGGAKKHQIDAIAEQLDDLIDDDEFWRFQARSLAIFSGPENLRTFRVPNALNPVVQVSDRFHIKPLLRSVSFPQSCYVLALAQKSVRVVEVSPDVPPQAVKVEGMPEDAGRAVQGVGEVDYWPSGRIHGAEGQKVLLRQFARTVDKALRPLLTGSGIPLILAATEPLASIYRSVNSYSQLAASTIEGSPEALSEAQLGERARTILDGIYRDELAAWRRLFEARRGEARAITDIAQAARAATMGAVDSVLVDIDEAIPGRIDNRGAVSIAQQASAPNYGLIDLVDEIATRVIATGGRVISVRKSDIPQGEPVAAILRYPA